MHEAYLRLAGQFPDLKPCPFLWRSGASDAADSGRLCPLAQGVEAECEKGPIEDNLTISTPDSEDLVALDEALKRLAAIDERQSRIVELRYFGGLTIAETASLLGISEKTVKRDSTLARTWLHREIFNLS